MGFLKSSIFDYVRRHGETTKQQVAHHFVHQAALHYPVTETGVLRQLKLLASEGKIAINGAQVVYVDRLIRRCQNCIYWQTNINDLTLMGTCGNELCKKLVKSTVDADSILFHAAFCCSFFEK